MKKSPEAIDMSENRILELSKHEVMLLIGAVGKEVTASAGTVANEEIKCLYELLRDVYAGPMGKEPETLEETLAAVFNHAARIPKP
jgi:hypothetical protein